MTEKKHRPVGAVVLAAGSSSRMGEAKQWLRLGGGPIGDGPIGDTILERVLRTVGSADLAETVLVLGFMAERAGELAKRPAAGGAFRVVVNPRYREGMASSLQAGLAALSPQTEAALIVLGDQPLVRPETLRRISDEYRRAGSKIVIPVYNAARGNPVLIDRSLFPEMMELTGDAGARVVFARHGNDSLRLPVDDAGILLDVDSREDFGELARWERAEERDKGEIIAAALKRRAGAR